MNKRLRVILAIILTLALSAGLVMSGCSGESLPEGPNGGNPNGDTPTEPDLTGLSRITSVSAGSAADLQIGGPAPDFRFDTAQGQTTSLSDLKGKMVLINFWATWCTHCRSEMPYFQQIYDEWSAEELVVLAINVGDNSDDVASFMQSNSLSFPVLLDSEGEAATRYGIPAFPTTVFIDKEGLLQDGRIGAFSSKEEIEDILNQLK